MLQPAIDEAPGLAFQSAILKVHGQEGGIRGDIDQAERLVEFDAVEQHDLAIDQRGIAQVKVAMAFANEALLAALFEQWAQARDAGFGPVFESVQLAQVFRLAEQRAYLFEVLPHRCDDRIGAVQRVVRLYLRGAEVEACDLLGQSVDMRIGQLAAGLDLGQQLGLRELAHLQHVLEGIAVAADHRSIRRAGDRQHFQVEVRCHALVEAQLFFAEMLARGQIGEVEEAEVHRLLDLVGVLAGEDHPGNMGFDDPKAFGGVRIQGRILQGGDQCLAHGHSLSKFLNGACESTAKQSTQS